LRQIGEKKPFYLVRYCLSGIKVWHCSDILCTFFCRLHSVNNLNQLSVLNYTVYLDMITKLPSVKCSYEKP